MQTKGSRMPMGTRVLISILVLLCLDTPTLAGGVPNPVTRVSFYFAAHQDDWQLFMNPSAFEDVTTAATKVIFIHMTAGDAGLGTGNGGRRFPYYRAREHGAELAIRFMADTDGGPTVKSASYEQINGRAVYRMTYRNTVSYFFRLPDGNPEGLGYATTGNQSLRLLAEAKITGLRAVDGSARYSSWADLVSTLRTVLDLERGKAAHVSLNVGELDDRINPGDHSDHRMTAIAALEAAQSLRCARRVFYVNYASARLPENLDTKQRDLASAVYAVTASGVWSQDHHINWRWYDTAYVGRNYFRAEEGKGRCDQSSTIARAKN
jgi:hypothetical protein